MRRRTRGFTLIEILLVLAIIGILATIILVAVGGGRQKSLDASFKKTVSSVQRGLALCCDVPGTPLGSAPGGRMCVGGELYPDAAHIGTITSGNCSPAGEFAKAVTPGTGNAGNCELAVLTHDGATFEGC